MSADHGQEVHDRLNVHVRAFRAEDYPRAVEIINCSYPDEESSVEETRHRDATWDYRLYESVRVVAEDRSGRVVGHGRINHMPDEFHPLKYRMMIVELQRGWQLRLAVPTFDFATFPGPRSAWPGKGSPSPPWPPSGHGIPMRCGKPMR